MKKILSVSIIFILISFNFLSSSALSTDITSYQLEFRDISLEEAQDVINRTIGSGSVNIKDGEDRLRPMKGPGGWFKDKDDAKIFGGVPFYGPRGLVVAYEYYLQCGDRICGSIYDVAPGLKDTNDVLKLFVKGAKCIDAYNCGYLKNAVTQSSYYTSFIPDANPVSLRLANRIEKGQIKFYHGIYAIGLDDKKVLSLDPRDEGLTRKELKRRLRGLADFSGVSPTLSLIYERAKVGDKPFECILDKELYGGTMLYSSYGRAMYDRPYCGVDGQKILAFGSYTLQGGYVGIADYPVDMLTGKIFTPRQPASAADNYQTIY